jgi:hypothetical protein
MLCGAKSVAAQLSSTPASSAAPASPETPASPQPLPPAVEAGLQGYFSPVAFWDQTSRPRHRRIALVTLAQQIAAGSGFEVAKTFLGGISNVIP